MTDLRTKIARALFDKDQNAVSQRAADLSWAMALASSGGETYWHKAADAVLAVLDLDTVRAEAQVEALREAADLFQYVTGSDTPVFSPATADYLHARADRIAREAGIETGEK